MHKLRLLVLYDQIKKKICYTHWAIKGKMASEKEKCHDSLIFDSSRKSECKSPFPLYQETNMNVESVGLIAKRSTDLKMAAGSSMVPMY